MREEEVYREQKKHLERNTRSLAILSRSLSSPTVSCTVGVHWPVEGGSRSLRESYQLVEECVNAFFFSLADFDWPLSELFLYEARK